MPALWTMKIIYFMTACITLCKVKVVFADGEHSGSWQISPAVKSAEFGHLYHDVVNSTRGVIYEYKYTEIKNLVLYAFSNDQICVKSLVSTTAVRITVNVISQTEPDFPIFFVSKQQQGILSWQIPLFLEYVYLYNKVSRTLCPLDVEHKQRIQKNQTIYVDISTMQVNNAQFEIKAIKMEDFTIETSESKNVSVTPSEPQYFMYTFPKDVDSVVIQATSDDDYCMVLSVQDIKCPVLDLDRDVQFEGVYQTMTEKAAITIEKRNYDSGSVYIVMVLKASDFSCNGIENIQAIGEERKKHVSLYVYGTISAKKYWVGAVGAAGVFLMFYLVAFAIGVCYHGCNKNRGIWTFSPHDQEFVAQTVINKIPEIEVTGDTIRYHATNASLTHRYNSKIRIFGSVQSLCDVITSDQDHPCSWNGSHQKIYSHSLKSASTCPEISQILKSRDICADHEETQSHLSYTNEKDACFHESNAKQIPEVIVSGRVESISSIQKQVSLLHQFSNGRRQSSETQNCDWSLNGLTKSHDRLSQSHDQLSLSHDYLRQSCDSIDRSLGPGFSQSNLSSSRNTLLVPLNVVKHKSKQERLVLLKKALNHKNVTKAWLHDGIVMVRVHDGTLAQIDSLSDLDSLDTLPTLAVPTPTSGVVMNDPDEQARASLVTSNQGASSYGTISEDQRNNEEIYKELRSIQHDSPAHTATSDTLSEDSLDTDEIDFLNDADKEKDIFRTKTALYVCDLARKKLKRQDKKYKIYWRNLIAISIFYGLPVIQLVITYQNVLHITGDQDICYYNFDCAHPLGVFTSFNNVFSNIGYIMLGILFLILVKRRSVIYRKVVETHPVINKKYGIPQHSGLYYSMGLALCMEGIMSACYHVCPTYSNFQFDTSYMYIIACLCMLRIYQNRHPDISAKAHTSYLLMALVIFIAVIGVVHGSSIFWTLFACCDIILILVLSVHIYYMGRWKIDRGIFKRVFLMVVHEFLSCGSRPVYLDRFIMLIIVNVLNWSFAIYGAVTEPGDFASFLLGIFIGNLLLYCTFYIIMKLRYRERIHPLAIVCIICACIVWGAALYFFFFHLTSWQLTPSGSRAGNQKCIVLDFYDAHDVWHFLSATSMFFSFLILLTLDDDLFSIRRDKIPVF